MKKLTLAGFIALLSLTCCNRRYSGHYHKPVPITDSTQEFINAARSFMELHESAAPPVTDRLTYTRTSLHKTPRWGLARIQYFSFGRGVVVPVNIAEPLGVKVGPHQVPVSASSITWLLLYQDSAKQWHPEVITRLPNDMRDGPFRGKVRVEDWQGHFLKAFLYMDDTTLSLVASSTIQRPANQQEYTNAPSLYAAMEMECTATDWYACYTYDGAFTGCDYAYSTEECSVSGGGGGSTATPSRSDYSIVGGGGGSGSSGADRRRHPHHDHGGPQCTVRLGPPDEARLTSGLQSILSAFRDNWMVENIDLLGASLQQYVQAWHHATYAQVGIDATVYQNLMDMGLEGSTMFQEDVVSKGLLPTVTANWGKLNEGGKCND